MYANPDQMWKSGSEANAQEVKLYKPFSNTVRLPCRISLIAISIIGTTLSFLNGLLSCFPFSLRPMSL
jgi:hypothetical protein